MAKIDESSFIPTHLQETAEELKAQLSAEPPKAEDAKVVAQRQKAYHFTFDHKTKAGREYKGEFTSNIPTVRDRIQIGLIQSSLQKSLPVESLDEETRSLCFILAHLTVRLGPNRPTWAKDLDSVADTDVLFELYQEVAQHSATFLG